jgi:hypothetical protein
LLLLGARHDGDRAIHPWLFQPDRKDERARIEALGGKVIQWNGYRVSGILAMSRSIGMYIGSSAGSW